MIMELFFAVTLGLLFGFALNRAGATNPHYIISMLRLTDLHLMKAILFAIGLATIALFAGLALGFIDESHLSIKYAYIGVVIGGALLGIGFAIAGYCPGTGLAAMATGRIDALFFVLGGLVGALIYTLVYGYLNDNTPFFDQIAGGKVMIARTDNENYRSLLPTIDGTLTGVGLGVIFVIIAKLLPRKILGK